MNPRLPCLVALCAVLSSASVSGQGITEKHQNSKPFTGQYQIYSGSLKDAVAPTPHDTKMSLVFGGQLAKELFDQIGPDSKQACGAGPNRSARSRGHLTCIAEQRDGQTAYSCTYGLDVRTGKSIPASAC